LTSGDVVLVYMELENEDFPSDITGFIRQGGREDITTRAHQQASRVNSKSSARHNHQ